MRVNCAPSVKCDRPRDDLAGHRSTATLALLSCAMLIVSLDQYIVVVALPDIGRDLDYSSQTLQSVISAYAVASSGFLLFGGRASDLLGRRRMLATGLGLYAVPSLAGGLATGAEVQLTARAAQGLGGALVFPSTLAVINTTFAEGHDRNRALGIWGGAGAAGLVVGVLLGGVLTRAFGWQAVFFVNVPLAGTRTARSIFPVRSRPPAPLRCSCSRSCRARTSGGVHRKSCSPPLWGWSCWPFSSSSNEALVTRSCQPDFSRTVFSR